MNHHSDPYRYWIFHENAMDAAREFAEETGVRQRVQRCTWDPPAYPCAAWFIAPTPAPAPEAVS